MDAFYRTRYRLKSERDGRIMLRLSLRPESPALLAYRAKFSAEGQKGGRPWPPQQSSPAPTGKSRGERAVAALTSSR
jgi:hypothetical protein